MNKKLSVTIFSLLLLIMCFACFQLAPAGACAASKTPAKVTGLNKTYKGHYNYKITWEKASGANKYKVYQAKKKTGKYKLVKTTKNRVYTAYVTPGKSLYIKVCAVNGKGKKGSYSKLLKVRTDDVIRLGHGIPKYWNEEINKSVKTYEKAMGEAGFIYLTDSHWAANTQHSPGIVNYLYKKENLGLAVFGGDVIAGTYEKTNEAIEEIQSFYGAFDVSVNLMSTTGNHDYNTSGMDIAPLTDQKLYELIYKPEKRFAIVAQFGRCAYTDDTTNKVRYISLYYDAYLDNANPQMGFDEEASYPTMQELNWMKTAIQDEALDEEWTIVLFTHGYWDFKKKGQTPQPTSTGKIFANYLLKLEGEEETKADIGCWMVGHTHRDMTQRISDDENQIRIICTNCDTYVDGKASRGSGYWGGWTMVKGHDTEQVIELVKIDTTNKKIHLIRVGAGKDRNYSY